jgi:hypothetical protein
LLGTKGYVVVVVVVVDICSENKQNHMQKKSYPYSMQKVVRRLLSKLHLQYLKIGEP